MLRTLFAVLFFFHPLASAQQELVQYRFSGKNAIQEKILELEIVEGDKEVLQLELPAPWFDTEKWVREGLLKISWLDCQPEEMREGRGELTQCIRRAFLSVRGEADNHSPGTLSLQVLTGGKLAVSYETPYHPSRSFSFIAQGKGNTWSAFARSLPKLHKTPNFTISPIGEQKIKNPRVFSAGISEGKYESRPVGFLFFGDSGTGSSAQYEVAKGIGKFCAKEKCDFAALLGDNIYDAGVQGIEDSQWETKFEKPYGNLHFPFFASLGNHDHGGDIQAQIDYTESSDKWRMPGRYYHYIKGNIDFFVIDSDDFDGDQQAWLADCLAKSQGQWKFVYGHHPIYSYGSHGHTKKLVKNLLPLLQKHNVDFYLCGHDHDKQVLAQDSLYLLVSGASAKTRHSKAGPLTRFNSATLGFAHMYCDEESCEFKYLDKNAEVEFSEVVAKRKSAAKTR